MQTTMARFGYCEAHPYGFAIGEHVWAAGLDEAGHWIDEGSRYSRWEITGYVNGRMTALHAETGRAGTIMYVQCYLKAEEIRRPDATLDGRVIPGRTHTAWVRAD